MTSNNPLTETPHLEYERRNMAKRIRAEETDELSKNGQAYHPKQSAANVVEAPETGTGVLLEAFFQNEDDVTDEGIVHRAVDELTDFMEIVGDLNVIYTGMNAVFTDTLQTVVDNRVLDVHVTECYPNVGKYVMADVADYETAHEELYNTRNRQLARNHVDAAVSVKVGNAPKSEAFTHEMRQLGVGTKTIVIR